MPAPEGGDWQRFLKEKNALGVPEVELATLNAGDRLVVETRNTRYELLWMEGDEVNLSTNRPDRRGGRVRVQGCAYGRSSTIKPGVLFCGGNLEYVSHDGQTRNRTTTIRGLAILRSGK
ncbi:MAG TPA: hypothetical protein VHD32_05355 [Candidatus Didemnitutus sp.]|nr:hypothetical protein [Candidatus Didemnitutus sp.]